MGSDMYMNPPKRTTKLEWQGDDLYVWSGWDGDYGKIAAAVFRNPDDQVLDALRLSYKVPDKDPHGTVTISLVTIYRWQCSVCNKHGDHSSRAGAVTAAGNHALEHGPWCKVKP